MRLDRVYFTRYRVSILKSFYGTFKLGIRREGKSRWERRVPIVPADLSSLFSEHSGLSVIVQPCTKRCYPNGSYAQVHGVVIYFYLGGRSDWRGPVGV